MVRYFNLLFLFTLSLSKAQAGQIDIQLLIEDEDLSYARSVTKTAALERENTIPYPHVSFLKINDKENIIKENFATFSDELNAKLEKASAGKPLRFIGQSINGYKAEKTGVLYWCIGDADKDKAESAHNQDLKNTADNLKGFIEEFMSQHKTKPKEPTAFKLMTPDEMTKDTAEKIAKIEESFVEYSKGFPHVSIAKGTELTEDYFAPVQKKQISFRIKGIKMILSNTPENSEERLPQIFITKYFGDPQYELVSGFKSLYQKQGLYDDVHMLLQAVGGSLQSSLITKEIEEIKKIKASVQKRKFEDSTPQPFETAKKIKIEPDLAPMEGVERSSEKNPPQDQSKNSEAIRKEAEILRARLKLLEQKKMLAEQIKKLEKNK